MSFNLVDGKAHQTVGDLGDYIRCRIGISKLWDVYSFYRTMDIYNGSL